MDYVLYERTCCNSGNTQLYPLETFGGQNRKRMLTIVDGNERIELTQVHAEVLDGLEFLIITTGLGEVNTSLDKILAFFRFACCYSSRGQQSCAEHRTHRKLGKHFDWRWRGEGERERDSHWGYSQRLRIGKSRWEREEYQSNGNCNLESCETLQAIVSTIYSLPLVPSVSHFS